MQIDTHVEVTIKQTDNTIIKNKCEIWDDKKGV